VEASRVRVTTQRGAVIELTAAHLVGDTLRGRVPRSSATLADTALALSDIATVELRRFHPAKTLALSMGIALPAAAFVAYLGSLCPFKCVVVD
jgi:hypothetical protein